MDLAQPQIWPGGLLLSWYGDDFTGSAAVMEVLTFAGIPSVLFLDIPTEEQRARFADARAVGIAGTARSRGPEWMDRNLPEAFRYLAGLQAQVTHYKVCSTLDSAPETGSIGKAIDIAATLISSPWIPLLVAAPKIRRYQVFGHLFASSPEGVRRLDRHPVMSRHPVTPMDEADAGAHVARQTARKTGLIDLEDLRPGANPQNALRQQLRAGRQIISIDVIDAATQDAAGRLIWQSRDGGIFAVGSQGLEYALVSHWRTVGLLGEETPAGDAGIVPHMVVISGSVSSITATQIEWAMQNGFAGVRFDALAVLGPGDELAAAEDKAVETALATLNSEQDPLVFTALGPDDPAVAAYHAALGLANLSAEDGNRRIGAALGRILDRILRRAGTSRAVICGGDTSGHAMAQLGVYALTAIAPTIPGAALYRAHSDDPAFASLELALKGGQMGTTDFLGWIKRGGGSENQREQAS